MKLQMSILAATAFVFAGQAQTTNPPAMSICMTNQIGTNYLSLTVTNHTAGQYYTLWYAYDISTPLGWWIGPCVTGQTNQTNFLFLEPQVPIVFFHARKGNDQDSDGIPDNQDADPFDPGVGAVQVIIFSPANGSIIQ